MRLLVSLDLGLNGRRSDDPRSVLDAALLALAGYDHAQHPTVARAVASRDVPTMARAVVDVASTAVPGADVAASEREAVVRAVRLAADLLAVAGDRVSRLLA